MKKNTLMKEEFKKLHKIANKMPKSINEALQFEEDDETMDDYEYQKPFRQEKTQEIDVATFVDDIRKKSLKGMASLADNPDSPEYQLLKKIWQICDKKPEQEGMQNQQIKQL